MEFKEHILKHYMHIRGKKLCYTAPKVTTRQLSIDQRKLIQHTLQAKLCSHGAIRSVVCCQDLTSKPLVAPLYVIVYLLRGY